MNLDLRDSSIHYDNRSGRKLLYDGDTTFAFDLPISSDREPLPAGLDPCPEQTVDIDAGLRRAALLPSGIPSDATQLQKLNPRERRSSRHGNCIFMDSKRESREACKLGNRAEQQQEGKSREDNSKSCRASKRTVLRADGR